MFTRKLFPIWIGIILLSGMFLMGQDTWGPQTCPTDTDGDGYGNPADQSCENPELDCDDDPSDDPSICSSCSCVEPECGVCARCINPGAGEANEFSLLCADGIDNDCDGYTDAEDTGCHLCQDSLDQLNSQQCQDEASVAVEILRTCIIGCASSELCINDCWTDFFGGIPACSRWSYFWLWCDTCYSDCGNDFRYCIEEDLGKTAAQCLSEVYDCANAC